MKTVLHIVGNRPQFIKLAVLYKELFNAGFVQKIIHTGQHSSAEMSDIFFSELSLPEVDHSLQLQNMNDRNSFIVEASRSLQEYFRSSSDSIVFVYGDTNTTLSGALAAEKASLPLFHFEAGVRTGDITMPEEINRVLTDRIANTNYCCTEKNYSNMITEGYSTSISSSRVKLTGDLMYDAFLKIPFADTKPVQEKNYVAVTIHRAGNILSKKHLSAIIDGLNQIHNHSAVVMPLHPHTKKRIAEYGLSPQFIILDPLGYPAMKTLLSNSSYVITDSGGAAREAFFSKKRSLIIMENPFWPEIIKAGCSINVSASSPLYESFFKLPSLDPDFESPIFGKGNAAQLIKDDMLDFQK